MDFMDSEDEQRPLVVLDSRFDSSSDDEEAAPLRTSTPAVAVAALKGSTFQPSGSEKQPGAAKQQAEAQCKRAAQAAKLRRVDQSPSSTGQPGGASKHTVDAAHPEHAVRMATMRGVEESDSSDGEDAGDAHATGEVKPPAVQPEQADSSDEEEGSKDAAAGIMSPTAQGKEPDSSEVSTSEEVGGSPARSSSSGDVRDSSSISGSTASKEVSSSLSKEGSGESCEEHTIRGGGVEEWPMGGQRQDPKIQVRGAGVQQSDSEQDGKDTEEGQSSRGEAGMSREYNQALNAQDEDNAADDQASDGEDNDSEQAGSALRAAPMEEAANGGEASTDVLSGGCRHAANLPSLCCASHERDKLTDDRGA